MALDHYYTLGRTGLRVSRLCLGTMTFGREWGWGCDEQTSRDLFNHYIEAGGNFIDTANIYTQGTSERWVGKFTAERGLRDRLVIATKFSHCDDPGNPNAGGNNRKNILRSLDASLQRLGTDYIDLYILHNWDLLTPPEEVIRTLDDVVRSGKVRYVGLSDVPAWYAASMQTAAELRGLEPVASVQLEYSLVERNIEREFVPLGLAKNMGITAWSPLAGGILSGKYRPGQTDLQGEGRLGKMQAALAVKGKAGANAVPAGLTDHAYTVLAEVEKVAAAIGSSVAQVAVNWVASRPGVASVIVGATRLSQLQENLQALDLTIPPEWLDRLNEVSQPPLQFPYSFFTGELQRRLRGGCKVSAKPDGYWRQELFETGNLPGP